MILCFSALFSACIVSTAVLKISRVEKGTYIICDAYFQQASIFFSVAYSKSYTDLEDIDCTFVGYYKTGRKNRPRNTKSMRCIINCTQYKEELNALQVAEDTNPSFNGPPVT